MHPKTNNLKRKVSALHYCLILDFDLTFTYPHLYNTSLANKQAGPHPSYLLSFQPPTFISPTGVRVDLIDEDIEENPQCCQNSLVGLFIGKRTYYLAVKEALSQQSLGEVELESHHSLLSSIAVTCDG